MITIGYMEMPADFKYKSVFLKGKPKHAETDPFSLRHPPMECSKRAKIFAPFSALKGFSEAIAEQEALAEERADRMFGRSYTAKAAGASDPDWEAYAAEALDPDWETQAAEAFAEDWEEDLPDAFGDELETDAAEASGDCREADASWTPDPAWEEEPADAFGDNRKEDAP